MIDFKDYRKKKGLSQFQLGKIVNVSQNYISLIEKGKNPGVVLSGRLAAALNIHVNEFRYMSQRDFLEFRAVFHLNKGYNYDNAEDVDSMKALLSFAEGKKTPYQTPTPKREQSQPDDTVLGLCELLKNFIEDKARK